MNRIHGTGSTATERKPKRERAQAPVKPMNTVSISLCCLKKGMKERQWWLTLKNYEGEGGGEDEAEAGGGREGREGAARGVGVEEVGYKGDLDVKLVLGLGEEQISGLRLGCVTRQKGKGMGRTRTDKLPQTYSRVPRTGLAHRIFGLAVQPIQNRDATMPNPPIMAGYNLYSMSSTPVGFSVSGLGRARRSMKMEVAAARWEPAMAAMKARPICWMLKS